MKSWTPIWSTIVGSSLWDESPVVRVLFVSMIAVKDADHICRISDTYQLHKLANISEADVIESLKILEAPDTKRLVKQEFEGRRIQKVEDGWLILNGEKYRSMIKNIKRQEYKNNWQRNKRNEERYSEGYENGVKKVSKGKTPYMQGKIQGSTDTVIDALEQSQGCPAIAPGCPINDFDAKCE